MTVSESRKLDSIIHTQQISGQHIDFLRHTSLLSEVLPLRSISGRCFTITAMPTFIDRNRAPPSSIGTGAEWSADKAMSNSSDVLAALAVAIPSADPQVTI